MSDDLTYNPPKQLNTFYQICKFPTKNNLYHVRKIIFNELDIIVKIFEKEYSEDIIKSFVKKTNNNKYKIYATINLKYVQLPTGLDMNEARSLLLNNSIKSCGYETI
jgi:hypothetical protein